MASGEFIFVLDRSGSMDGEDIQKAVEALTLFLQSLPSGSYFNIYSFGSSHSKLYEKSVEYTKVTLNETINKISSFRGDMGGTNLLSPMKTVLKAELINL